MPCLSKNDCQGKKETYNELTVYCDTCNEQSKFLCLQILYKNSSDQNEEYAKISVRYYYHFAVIGGFWSALKTNLCVNASCLPWLVVLSCHRNFKTSKDWSTLSSKIEITLIESKQWKLIIRVNLMILSRNFHSLKVTKPEMMNEDTNLHKI